jgi:mRNA-degrading endonuclease RelE of RelBE toxin-antitoxin system/PHD/YefM family antitoxin component YafN of YafNO toxin-antitoxin module
MASMNISAARDRLPEAVELAHSEAVFLERYGRRAAVLLSPERYDELMEALEEAEDVAAFDVAMAEEGPNIPWDQAKADLGWTCIELRPAAVRALKKLDPPVARRLQGAIALLAEDPRPPAARSLRGRPGLRVRVGDYRIIYTVEDDVLLVVVVTVGHRRDVYDR